MDSNSHPHTLSNDEEDMDDQPFGNPDSAGTASLYFESFNMQAGHAGSNDIPEMRSFGLPTQEAIMRAGNFLSSTSPVEFMDRNIPPACLTKDAFDLQRLLEEEIRRTRANDFGFLRSPTVSTRLHTPPAFVVPDALYASNSQKPPKEDRGPHVNPAVIPLDNDVPTTVHDPPFFDFVRNGKTHYRCNMCGAETARKPDMTRHHKYARCHCPLPRFRCHCGKKYGREDSLKKHERECHKTR